MKKSYLRLLIFELITILLVILSGFVSSILSGYVKVVSIIILLVLFKFMFGFEKDRHRYWKSIIIELLICLLVYFLLYYILGILIGFTKVVNYWTLNNIIYLFIPLILNIILKEIFRYMMLVKSEGSKLLVVTSTIVCVVLDLAGLFNESIFISPYAFFCFIAMTVIPIISTNVFCSYMCCKTGYKPTMFYLLIKNLYIYIVPIIPNPNEYIYSMIELLIPMIFLFRIYRFFLKDRDEQIVREYHKKKFYHLIIPTIIVIFFVYITSGCFYHHAIAIASGSMDPYIKKGDVVIIEKNRDFDHLDVDQVIAYKKGNIIVVHRLVKKIQVEGKYYFYTKGDANNDIDNYEITEDMFIGIVNIKIPYIGYPTVWIDSL